MRQDGQPFDSRAHFKSLTSMRALAAILVFGFHANVPPLAPLTSQGRLGVSFFFILSGLLLGMAHRPGETAARFYRRRLARLYPAYLVALAIGLSTSLYLNANDSWTGILAIVGLQSWVPDANTYYAWNPVSWSLSDEAFFYLLFPFLAPLVLRLSPTMTWLTRATCLMACVGLGVLGAVYQPDTFEQPNDLIAWLTYIFPAGRLFEFIFGLTLVQAVRGNTITVSKLLASLFLAVAYLAASLNPAGLGLSAITLVPLGLFLVAYCQADASGAPSILHMPLLIKLGEISYCFYLVHHIALRLAAHFVGGTIPGATVVLALPVAAAAAWLLHERVEKPLDTRFNGRARASVLNR